MTPRRPALLHLAVRRLEWRATACCVDTGARQHQLTRVERPISPCILSEDRPLLTEAEVQRSFRKLFGKDRKVEPDAFEKALALLDELRPESPLRVRLEQELEELREIHGVGNC